MLESLFGAEVIEKILFFLLINETGYGSMMSSRMNVPLYSVQRGLDRLEKGGILVSQRVGKTLIYRFNPRYPFLEELTNFLKTAYEALPSTHKAKYLSSTTRRRPRSPAHF